ncbi:BTB/POZ and MATH domain-containing protein 1 [Sorghum bicolor]|uniref:BTB domain-containing protein n=1 Tax=Sorghum bicolor TaxID=4558 RepID=C5YJ12_SORBI|nr:BTB/POZ and MATH domain-containing protein 1 [Sorghum bicolor]EES14737.1 hypothetical protein SORBI_3007G082300 [Sorghum bicolor]|eukprot:XP_002445242.1 BTB/POZ and MATH domain-containing protein 1 [Sorghum bicolor]
MSTPTKVSTCTADTEQGKHVFKIFDYSQHKGMGQKMLIRSGTFTVGGHDWSVLFYPDGYSLASIDCISVYVELLGKERMVWASCDLRLVNHTTGLPSFVHKTDLRMFNSADFSRFAPQTGMFMNRSKFESSAYLQNDSLTIECNINVKKAPRVSATRLLNKIEVPPSNITVQLGKLLDAEEGKDVTFIVGGETFAAHKILLAMRSPVFKAQLYGPMSEAKAEHVTIQDMQPAVFRTLLHFIYTDSLPLDYHGGGTYNCEMIWHLLEAADRYAVDRLSLVCQSILCKNLDVENVSTTLVLACQHGCNRLKDDCLEFITSKSVMDAVVATQSYKNLKIAYPSVLLEVLEKKMKSCKT